MSLNKQKKEYINKNVFSYFNLMTIVLNQVFLLYVQLKLICDIWKYRGTRQITSICYSCIITKCVVFFSNSLLALPNTI